MTVTAILGVCEESPEPWEKITVQLLGRQWVDYKAYARGESNPLMDVMDHHISIAKDLRHLQKTSPGLGVGGLGLGVRVLQDDVHVLWEDRD